MKTFKDLKFEGQSYTKTAIKVFKNGYGVYVVSGLVALTDANNPYAVTVLKDGYSYFETHITPDGPICYCNIAKVTKIMKQIQELGKNKTSKDTVKT